MRELKNIKGRKCNTVIKYNAEIKNNNKTRGREESNIYLYK